METLQDQKLCRYLDWEMRFKIILGIARGLVCLHHDSRLRIIHRDLKTSNILLDEEMNPKISDLGLARMVEGKETEANTNRGWNLVSLQYTLSQFSLPNSVLCLHRIYKCYMSPLMKYVGMQWLYVSRVCIKWNFLS
jgi:serine/threonine protein kinase